MLLVALCVLPAAHARASGNTRNDSFNRAKKILLQQIYPDHSVTFYCGSRFEHPKRLEHRAYHPLKESARAYRLEWEHVVPAHAFGQSFRAWREGASACRDTSGTPFKGRRCAEKSEPLYRYMQADLHNLVPAIGELNGLRSNYSFAMLAGEERRFGACDMEIAARKAEPPAHVRGDIARIYFYMEDAYPGRGIVSGKKRKLFEAWDRVDPVDGWECERQRRIEALQGNRNRFVAQECLALGL